MEDHPFLRVAGHLQVHWTFLLLVVLEENVHLVHLCQEDHLDLSWVDLLSRQGHYLVRHASCCHLVEDHLFLSLQNRHVPSLLHPGLHGLENYLYHLLVLLPLFKLR